MTVKAATATAHTNHGDIATDLFGNHTPNAVDNFIGLAEGIKEYKGQNVSDTEFGPSYDEAIFHRIIAEFVIQGGDLLGTDIGGPSYAFDDEIHPELQFDHPYLPATTNVGKCGGYGTNGSQLFITMVPTPYLGGAHTTFGKVADDASKKTVDEIACVAVDHQDRPLEPVVIVSIDIEK